MKKTAKLGRTLLLGSAALALTLTACKKKEGCTDPNAQNYDAEAEVDNGTCTYPEDETVITVTSNITTSTTWETGKVYILGGRIAVTNGATLTIQPGVIVKGQAGTGANATALLIARGAKLNAVGTASQPIIFTSVADEIMPGQIASPNMPTSLNGLWGGLIILGNAPISAAATSVQIEGIPASDANGLYGGTDAADNSGTIRYVSIRHGGANIGDGNEINGLTLGGVGSATTIDHIEVISNQDDGVEFFGGTVNVTDVLVWNSGDDAIDTDQAWAGSLSNFIVICGNATDHALEIDGPEGALLAGHTVSNGSIKGNNASELADFRSSARGAFSNLWFFGNTDPSVDGRGDLSLSSGSDVTFGAGTLTFANMQYDSTGTNVTALNSVFKGGTDVHAAFATTPTVGATKSAFASWTWADVEGELNDF